MVANVSAHDPAQPANRQAAGIAPAAIAPSRRRQRLAVIAAVCAGLVAAAWVAWWLAHRAPPVRYTTAPVSRGMVSRVVIATGTVNPVLTVIVGTYVSGVIQDLYCDFNTRVHKGQLCAKIDPRLYQSTVNQARGDLANAKAQIVKNRALLAYTEANYRRNSQLLKRGIVSQDTADNAKSAYDQARAQIEVDTATIQQKTAALESALVNLGYTDIVSPVDGTVVSRNVTIGQTVAASFQTPTLFLIATDLTKMQVDANVSESDVGDLREGDKAAFTVEAFPNRRFEGSVVQVRQAPQTVQNIVTYDVLVGVANPDLLLKPGMTATTRIVTAERQNALRVPDQALRYTPSAASSQDRSSDRPSTGATASRVWLLRDGEPVAVSIATGLDDDTYSEVTAGPLREGDRVITAEDRSGTTASAGPGASVVAPGLRP